MSDSTAVCKNCGEAIFFSEMHGWYHVRERGWEGWCLPVESGLQAEPEGP